MEAYNLYSWVMLMGYYYISLMSRSHAFLLERRLKADNVPCELTYMPRELLIDMCNMGVKFEESWYAPAINIISRSGLPGYRLYREVMSPDGADYYPV